MAEQTPTGQGIPTVHEVLIPGSESVQIEGVAGELMTFAARLGYLHYLLFGLPLVITSGRDGEHVSTSLHEEGRALDFRTIDKTEGEMQVFLAILAYAAPHQNCRVFDERVGAGGEHVHVEYHGE